MPVSLMRRTGVTVVAEEELTRAGEAFFLQSFAAGFNGVSEGDFILFFAFEDAIRDDGNQQRACEFSSLQRPVQKRVEHFVHQIGARICPATRSHLAHDLLEMGQ